MEIHSPEDAGMSSERLARISAIMEQFVKNNQLPGILTLVQRKGKVVHLGKYGVMDIEAGKPMQEDALFRIYSMTKPIVSVALMMLLEEGRLSLNDPVSQYIPAFSKTKVYAGSTPLGPKLVDQDPVITIHHLLTHTAGLTQGLFFDSPVENLFREVLLNNRYLRSLTLEEVVDRIAGLPLVFQPGTQWRYSCAHDVIGYVVQIIADMPLADFLEARVFKPLGMTDTAFHVPAGKLNRLAQIYRSEKLYDPILCKQDEVLLGDVSVPTHFPSGGGGLISTLKDYFTFCNCLIHNGQYEGGRLLGRKTIAWMTSDHIPGQLKPLKLGTWALDHGFGLGFGVTTALGETRALTSIGEYGWGGAANTNFWIDPAEEFIGIMMTQHMPVEPYPVQERFKNLAYQAIAD